MSEQDYEQLTLFQVDSRASRSVLPGSDEARRITVISGRKCLELYKKSGPLGSLARMLLGSSQWRSTRCYLTWKASDTTARRLLFRLVPSMPRTEETDARLLDTGVRIWPTPSASDCGRTAINPIMTKNGTIRHKNKEGGQSYARLDAVAAMFPTPKAQNARAAGQKHGDGGPSLDVVVGGQLNPTWVEWLMGFPIGWTDLNVSETQ